MTMIRFTRGAGLGGAFVRWATFSPFAHVGLKLDDGTVLDATPEFGVSVRHAMDDATTEYWKILAPKKVIEDAVAFAMRQVGKPYDFTSIIGLAFRRDWHKDDKWECSELVQGAFDAAHWPLVRDGGRLDRITPRDILLSSRIMPVVVDAR